RVRIRVRAHPGASRERVVWDGVALHVWVTARAVEGAANRALTRAIARHLGVREAAVSLLAGGRGRDKLVEVDGVGPAQLEALRPSD
ncbi:MAG TPA: DUF167 domain-containing protein, partial [Methylomirabilota bacterium]|nr:DUF167 domain-containing protein [Methylomirabilota bacterium]